MNKYWSARAEAAIDAAKGDVSIEALPIRTNETSKAYSVRFNGVGDYPLYCLPACSEVRRAACAAVPSARLRQRRRGAGLRTACSIRCDGTLSPWSTPLELSLFCRLSPAY